MKWLKMSGTLFLGLVVVGLIFHQRLMGVLLENVQPTVKIAKNTGAGNYDWQSVPATSSLDVLSAQLAPGKVVYLGMIAVPEIGLALPITNGVGGNNMLVGAGTLFANQRMGAGNYALASHFMQGSRTALFSPVYYQGAVGQTIYLTDAKRLYVYQTTLITKVPQTDTAVVYPQSGQKLVTLVTCNVTTGAGRGVMQGVLQSEKLWATATATEKGYFSGINLAD
jgi:sortase A